MEDSSPPGKNRPSPGRPLLLFLLILTAGLAAGYLTPLREVLNVESIERFARHIGWWGPLGLLAIGAFSPMFFLPRWPVCVAAGMLYGLAWGFLLGNVAGTLGAGIHYFSARTLVSDSSTRLLQRLNMDPDKLTPRRSFWLLFILRAFPLSNSSATNVLAGSLNISAGTYLLATFLGMIPSTLMFVSGGKIIKKPDPHFYAVAAGLILVMGIGTAVIGKRLFKNNHEKNEG